MGNHNLKILHSFQELHTISNTIFAAIGTFDGIHMGHTEVIAQAVCAAHKANGTAMVITFDRHPMSLLDPTKEPLALADEETKIRLLETLGIDYLLLLPMSKELLQLSPQEFIAQLLGNTTVGSLYIGTNFTFGRNGIGTPQLLQEISREYGVEVHPIPLRTSDNNLPISSSRIREAIQTGKMELATALLGRPYGFSAIVVYGDQRGRLLGFPTANFQIPRTMVCPPDGVYVNRVELDGKIYYGIGNIGDNPTFQNQIHRLEIHILDFSENIYGKEIRIEFLTYLRDELKFEHINALKEQMNTDMKQARLFLHTKELYKSE